MNLLSIHEIASRLDNRFTLLTAGRRTALPQHQTLRAAIEWSHDLLGHAEKILFRRLSVFTDSFSLQAAEAVCGDSGISQYQVLDLLGRLVDKSLLQVDPGPSDLDLATRYRFLDSIVSFSRLKLAEAQETSSLRDRYAANYADFVESIEPKLLMQDQGRWHKLLQVEGGNIRTVIEWGVEQGVRHPQPYWRAVVVLVVSRVDSRK